MTDVPIYDDTIHQGEDFSLSLWIQDDNGNAVDLTGYTAQMQLREAPNNVALLSLATSGSGITITAATGEIDIAITAAQTAAFEFVQCLYDLAIKSTGNVVTYKLRGTFTVTPRITRVT